MTPAIVRYNLTPFLYDCMSRAVGDDKLHDGPSVRGHSSSGPSLILPPVMKASNSFGPVFIRSNPLKITRDQLWKRLLASIPGSEV
jgi:hypothetical protein